MYVPYFYQSGRFLMAPAAVLSIAAAAGVAAAAERYAPLKAVAKSRVSAR